jgi:sulfate adenylyltransferase subunit 2
MRAAQQDASSRAKDDDADLDGWPAMTARRQPHSHLASLEAESIHILREATAEASKPVLLYSIGKDSAVLLHLALKAFYPGKPPFPLLHIDTTWKFRDMIAFRDRRAAETGMELVTYTNADGLKRNIVPFGPTASLYTDVMKTEALKQALDLYGFDVAFGGARRDEEKSRAKERIVSVRSEQHRWDPKNQRPEPWRLFNTRKAPGQTLRVFPLSNWTERDVWDYIEAEGIPVVPLYFAAPRPIVERSGTLIMLDDDRLPLLPGERPQRRMVRFRTLGCYPLTGAIDSEAVTLQDVVAEMREARMSERQGRLIDHDGAASMERKKQEGYF